LANGHEITRYAVGPRYGALKNTTMTAAPATVTRGAGKKCLAPTGLKHLIDQNILYALFCRAFSFAHLARCAEAILLRAARDSVRFFGIVTTLFLPLLALALAHLALCAAAIRALPAAEIVPLFALLYVAPKAFRAAEMALICFASRSCSCFNNWATPKIVINLPRR
jgi:hypothetical protein